jgi:menaquinone-9 beta-reductase
VTERVETLVVGGGPAGAAAALSLAASGRPVLVLEREREARHQVCGEFLSVEVLQALERVGLAPGRLGAVPIERVRVSARGRGAEAALPFPAAGLSRRTLDAALLAAAEARGAEVRRGVRVRAVAEDGRVELVDGTTMAAGAVLLATGKHELRGRRRATPWQGWRGMVGLKMHMAPDPAARQRLGRRVALFFFSGGCAGLQPVEGGVANLCITLDAAVRARAGSFEGLVRWIGARDAGFAAAMAGAVPVWPRPLAIARVPYGHLHRPQARGGRIWRIGDQAAVTPSFTGDGLALALQSGLAAAEHCAAGGSRRSFEEALRRAAGRQLRPAMRLQGLMDRGWIQGLAVEAARWQPWLLGQAARRTRVTIPLGAHEAGGRRWS